jgi:hypothetical protein
VWLTAPFRRPFKNTSRGGQKYITLVSKNDDRKYFHRSLSLFPKNMTHNLSNFHNEKHDAQPFQLPQTLTCPYMNRLNNCHRLLQFDE